MDADDTSLAVLTALTSSYTDSECENVPIDAVDISSVEDVVNEASRIGAMSGCVLGRTFLHDRSSQPSESLQGSLPVPLMDHSTRRNLIGSLV